MKYKMSDRMMPNQKPLLEYYRGNECEIGERIFNACLRYSKIQDEDIYYKFPKSFPAQQYMGTDPIVRKLQSMLISQINAKKILEIGTFVGVSTINFARSVGKDGHVTTIEKFSEFASIARENFKDNNIENITLLEGDAYSIIPKLLSAGGGGL
ncbi:O-methyltransferase [Helicobacter valdiviensis]|uniref:O-methyltransferase n=1 Tax=Helicobacter valdiviensis TaxID=1458358 RepID=UPI001FEA5F5F|nr:hypothetical protein [Helicobacter valdiviensis]